MIHIKKNPNGDTRTAPKDVTYEQFVEANNMHIMDVAKVMEYLAKLTMRAGYAHDHTKVTLGHMFYRNFRSSMNNGTNFVEGEWYQHHIRRERHHLLSHCPDDVDLLDVLEMIADCVCDGMTRSGEVRDLEISTDILERAVQNTVKLIRDEIVVEV